MTIAVYSNGIKRDDIRLIVLRYKYPIARYPDRICGGHSIAHGYRCTRPYAHTGTHVAHTSDGSAVAAWEPDSEVDLKESV